MGLEIVGAGFGRTGTLSLKLALEKLGLGPCYHMLEVIRQPEHAPLWTEAGRGGYVDWDELFDGFAATVDWPGARFWRELSRFYPDAKVLLSVRPAEDWYDSVERTIYQAMTTMEPPPGSPMSDQLAMARELVLERTFDRRFEDRAHAIEVFERHNQSVRDSVAADRLLVYELGSGWGPLCEFFQKPVPEEDFPRTNTSEDFLGHLGKGKPE
jgi:hypothetical protein